MNNINTLKNRELATLAQRIVRRAVAEKRPVSYSSLCDEILATRPMHFYVSYDRASKILHRIERTGVENIALSGSSRGMWIDLYGQVRNIMEARPRLNFSQALTQALYFARPMRLYMTKDALYRLLKKNFSSMLVPEVRQDFRNYC